MGYTFEVQIVSASHAFLAGSKSRPLPLCNKVCRSKSLSVALFHRCVCYGERHFELVSSI